MDIYWIQSFTFNNAFENAGELKRAYATINGFGTRSVAVTRYLNVVAPGAHIEVSGGRVSGDLGTAAIGIKWYAFYERPGHLVIKENDYFEPNMVVRNCVAFQLAAAYRRTWMGGGGLIQYFN